MNKTTVVVFFVFVAVGFIAYSYRNTILNSLHSLGVATQPLQSAYNQIQNAYANIPEPWKGYVTPAVIGGIGTAFTMFFAWTKTRAMTKLQQTQAQAQSLVSEKLVTEQDNLQKDQKITDLTQQLQTAQQQNLSFDTLQQQLTAKQDDYNKLETRYREAQSMITSMRSPSTAEMKRRLEQEGFLVHEKVT